MGFGALVHRWGIVEALVTVYPQSHTHHLASHTVYTVVQRTQLSRDELPSHLPSIIIIRRTSAVTKSIDMPSPHGAFPEYHLTARFFLDKVLPFKVFCIVWDRAILVTSSNPWRSVFVRASLEKYKEYLWGTRHALRHHQFGYPEQGHHQYQLHLHFVI